MAVLNVVGGQLLGASDINVDESFYNVDFLEGTCVDLYGVCDAASDSAFQSPAEVELAAQALLAQVFLDGIHLFDLDP